MCFVLDLELPFLVVTITNLVFRVFTASLIEVYTFVEIFLSFLATYGLLKVTEKCEESANKRPDDQERIPDETNTSLTIENKKEQPLEDAEAIQLEPCESSKNGVKSNASQPIADRDVESQEGLQVAEDPERGSEKILRCRGSEQRKKEKRRILPFDSRSVLHLDPVGGWEAGAEDLPEGEHCKPRHQDDHPCHRHRSFQLRLQPSSETVSGLVLGRVLPHVETNSSVTVITLLILLILLIQ